MDEKSAGTKCGETISIIMALSPKDNILNMLRPVRRVEIKHPVECWYTARDPLAHQRLLKLTRGIYLMEEWWKERNLKVSYSITDYNQYYLHAIPQLELFVREFHRIIAPQQQLDDKNLIFGLGATQLLHAAIYALCIVHAGGRKKEKFIEASPLYFTHQTPGYLDTKELIESFKEFNAQWIDFESHQSIAFLNLVELITSPNNPDSRYLTQETRARYIVNDRVNLWPFFMTNSQDKYLNETLEQDIISVFSLPKILSFSGSRVGYAFISDPRVAKYMKYFIMLETHGLSSDGQIRCLTALRYLIENNLVKEYIDCISEQFSTRWDLINKIIPNTEIKLLNQDGPNIWIKTPSNAQRYLFDKYKIIATYGPEYGASDEYARLNMQCTTNEFQELLHRLESKIG
jgi:bifunctional pyridoxal-dependent enzyme with beta-cystathionase and maltose regulon repressor activities